MVRVGILQGLVCSFVLGLTACDSANRQVVEICEKGCDCQSGLPAVRDACFDECLAEIGEVPPGVELSDECMECVQLASCVTLQSCFEVCRGDDAGEEDF